MKAIINRIHLKKATPHLIPILIFLLISLIYFSPVLEGKRINAGDLRNFKGISREIVEYRNSTGEEPLWTNSIFGGMPTYLISTIYPANIIHKLKSFIYTIPRPASYLFLKFLLFYLLCVSLGASPWISLVGSLAYGFSTYFFVLFGAGHSSKTHTLVFNSMVVTGILLAYRNKKLLGSIITAFGISWMLSASHPQMTYYTGLLVMVLILTYFIFAIREKALPDFFKTSLLLLAALLLAICTNFSRLYTTYEYGKFSMRGKSELSSNKGEGKVSSGLEKDYIWGYSYDLGEAVAAFIPRFKGGGMREPLGEESETFKVLSKSQGRIRAKKIAQALPLYWGDQPIVEGSYYFGAVLCFLFVLGLFIVKGKDKWWIAVVVIFSFLLSLGKNLPAFNSIMIDHFPWYNKFRDVKGVVVIQQFSMALLGVLAIKNIFEQNITKVQFRSALKYAFGITGGLALIFILFPGLAGDFTGNSDSQFGWPEHLIEALREDRRSVLKADALRSLIFVSLAALTVWLFWEKKIKGVHALTIWSVLVLTDMWPINKKHLNHSNFEYPKRMEIPFPKTEADGIILEDTDPDFRVLNTTVNPFVDASTSFYHKSVGGYHGAKMQRYQELADHYLSNEIYTVMAQLRQIEAESELDSLFINTPVLNMLNTKYMIFNTSTGPIMNNNANGHAWLVDNVKIVDNPDQELEALGVLNFTKEAVVDKQFSSLINNMEAPPQKNNSSLLLKSYSPNKMVYQYKGEKNNVAIFSEIYYPKGWNAYIDGKLTPHFRANYILRAMSLPQGEYEIEFKFEPKSYIIGNRISLISSIILIIATLALILQKLRAIPPTIKQQQ